MLSSGPMWGLMIGQIAHDWALFMINADLPKYMKSVMKFSIAEVSISNKYTIILLHFDNNFKFIVFLFCTAAKIIFKLL